MLLLFVLFQHRYFFTLMFNIIYLRFYFRINVSDFIINSAWLYLIFYIFFLMVLYYHWYSFINSKFAGKYLNVSVSRCYTHFLVKCGIVCIFKWNDHIFLTDEVGFSSSSLLLQMEIRFSLIAFVCKLIYIYITKRIMHIETNECSIL